MRRFFVCSLLFVLLLALAGPVEAQQRLFAVGYRDVVEVSTASGSFGRVVRRVAQTPSKVGPDAVVPIAGGAALVWATNGTVALYDISSGHLGYHQLPGLATKVLGTDASSYRVLVQVFTGLGPSARHGVVVVDLHTLAMRTVDLGPTTVPLGGIAYAPRSNVLLVARHQPSSSDLLVDVVDVDSGEVRQQLTVVREGTLSVNELGTRLYVSAEGGIDAYDVVSGTLLSAYDSTAFHDNAAVLVEEGRGRVLRAAGDSQRASLHALTADTLVPLGAAQLPLLQVPPPTQQYRVDFGVVAAWDVNPLSATIFALESVARFTSNDFDTTCTQSTLVALDAATGSVRTTADGTPITATNNCLVDLVRLTEPRAPGAFAAAVDGRRVSFTWGAEAATHYEIEAGATPGTTALVIPVSSAGFAIDGVPPGIYYVRVRAANVIGKSAASQELRIVVE